MNTQRTQSTDLSFVAVSGYGWTGSGAAVDLLKEFQGYGSFDTEFRLIKDPHGIIDLESALLDNWEFIRHDTAIRDFLKFTSVLSRPNSKYGKYGAGFSEKLSINFINESKAYIDELTNFRYSGRTMIHDYNLSSFDRVSAKIWRRFKTNSSNSKLYFCRPTEDQFLLKTREYLQRIFKNYSKTNNAPTIILDQAIPPTNISKSIRYFDNIKVILIDRDPRDIFAELCRQRALIGPELIGKGAFSKYINWHQSLRAELRNLNTKNVLQIRFEDLVFNYEQTVRQILTFLDDQIQHNSPFTFFDPEKSIKNIGIWRSLKDTTSMQRIAESLEEDCYFC